MIFIPSSYIKTAAFKAVDDVTLDMIVAPWTEENGKASFYRQLAQADDVYTDEVQPLYAHISSPVSILWGCEDAWIPLERGEALHDMIPASIFRVIPDAGHLVIEEKPDQLIREIRPFLQDEEPHCE